MADAVVVFSGWNSSSQAWGAGTWGNDVAFSASATGAVGTVTVSGASSVPSITGVAGTGQVGSASTVVGTGVNVGVTGIAATGGVGSTTVQGNSSVTALATLPTTSFAVTVVSTASGNRYAIDGSTQATVTMTEGQTYKFDQSNSSNNGHPLRLSITPNGSHAGGSAYTTGVTVNGTPGQAGAYTQIVVAVGAPTLYYYCTQHSNMGGTANTQAGIVGVGATPGQATAVTDQIIPVVPSGLSSTALVNTATIVCECDANVNVTGVSGLGQVSRVTVWGRIIPDTNPNIWTEIAA